MSILDGPIYVPRPGEPGYVEIKPGGYIDSPRGALKNPSPLGGCIRCGQEYARRGKCPMYVPFGDCFSDDASMEANRRLNDKRRGPRK